MALTLPQQQMQTILHSAQCFRVVLFEALVLKCKCKCTPQGQPCLSQLSLSSVVSTALSSRATNPQRVTLSTHPHHYPHIFLAVVEPSVSVYETPAPLMLFVHQSSLKPASQYRKCVCSLSLSSKLH